MNILDRAIEAISPQWGLRRAGARAMLRAYAGAQTGRRQTGFGTAGYGGSANTGIGTDLSMLRDRTRAMVRNSGHGAAIVDVTVRHAVGAGIVPSWNTGSDRADGQVSALWEQWVRNSDAEGELDYYGQQSLLTRSMVEGGESLMRFVDLSMSEGGRVPLRLQMLEGDHLDGSRDGTVDGKRARLGVALGDYNRRLGYWLYPQHPGEAIFSTAQSLFVSRADVVHLYRPLRIGQVRGVPWMAPVLMSAKDLADLLQFTIVKTQVEASWAGFITNLEGQKSPLDETVENGQRKTMPEPGTLLELKQGQDIKFPQLSSSSQFGEIALNVLQTMAVGAGLTYDQVTGDLRQANYSSLRAGKIEHRRFIEQVQWHCIIPRICDPVADRFIERAILSGALRARADGYGRDWIPPANEPIDPKKDLEADIAAVRAGRMSPQEFIGMWGRDWRKVVGDTEEFWKAIDAKKGALTFDIDPRKPLAGTGGNAAADPATEDAAPAAQQP